MNHPQPCLPFLSGSPGGPTTLAHVWRRGFAALAGVWFGWAWAAPPPTGAGLTAAPPTVTGFTINGGAATTPAREVQLAWTLSGPAATHFRVSESASFPNQAWNPMPLALPWRWIIPSAGEGPKTVRVQFMNDYGQSDVRSATIELRMPPVVNSISIENGAAATGGHRVNVRWTTSGVYTHYRVGKAGFDTLPWVAANAPPATGVDVDLFSASTPDQRSATVYVQLKRDNDTPVTAQASIRFEPPLVDVTLDHVQSSAWMKAHGVASQLLGGQGGCRSRTEPFDSLNYLVAAADGSLTGPRCGFTLFQGYKLRGRWTLKAVDLRLGLWLPPGMVALGDKKKPASTCRFIAGPALGTSNMALGVEVIHPGDAVAPGDSDVETYCILSRIVLNGPQASGTSW